MKDAKDYYRRKCSIPCTCAERSRKVSGTIVDLSFDGALITRSTSLPLLGSNVVITLGHGEGDISFEGEVVYVQPQGPFGVKFSGTSNDNLEKLEPVFQSYAEAELKRPLSSFDQHDLMLVK